MEDIKMYMSKEELRTHNKREDLWISIKGKVYNVSDWVNTHPGGDLPLSYFAGQDVTDVFLSYHPISSWKYLDKFFTGFYLEDYKVSKISEDYRKLWLQFQKKGFFERKGHTTFILVCISLIMFFGSVYGVLSSDSLWVHLTCAGLMGFIWIQLAWLLHDSAHYDIMINSEMNKFAQYLLLCLGGFSFTWWKSNHNSHHIANNSLEFDPDTQLLPFFMVSPKSFVSLPSHYYKTRLNFDSVTKFLVSHQNWTFFPIMTFLRTYLFGLSVSFLLSNKKLSIKIQEFVGMFVFFSWFSLLISCLPNWYERVLFVIITLGVTGIQNFQIGVSHAPCDVYVGPPSGDDWVEKQIIGSLDIECSPWMDWFHGGNQFQIEHHLFPRMPRCQLREISPYVQELCNKHNLPYNCTSFWEASRLTINNVRDVAHHARKFTDAE